MIRYAAAQSNKIESLGIQWSSPAHAIVHCSPCTVSGFRLFSPTP
jgi:hypothetical protein